MTLDTTPTIMRRLDKRDLSFAISRALANDRARSTQQKRSTSSVLQEVVADLLADCLLQEGYVVLYGCSAEYLRRADIPRGSLVEVVESERKEA